MRRLTAVAVIVLVASMMAGLGQALLEAGPAGAGTSTGPSLLAPGPWSVDQTPDPSPAGSNQFGGVSCVSRAFCMAVGASQGPMSTSALIAEWDGHAWSRLPEPTPAPNGISGPVPTLLEAVSCASSTFCMAVGVQKGAKGLQTLAEQWDGTTWSIVATPTPDLSGSSPSQPSQPSQPVSPVPPPAVPAIASPLKNQGLVGVSCRSATFCMAVGFLDAAQGGQPLAERWNGSTWTVASVPAASPSAPQELEGVDCSSPTWCMAVGLTGPPKSPSGQPLIERWDGATWTPSAAAITPDGGQLVGVSCWGTTFCMAVGYAKNDTQVQNLTQVWSGSTWSNTATPALITPAGSGLAGVSCLGPSFCVATGTNLVSLQSAVGSTQILGWNGRSWTRETSPSPGPSQNLILLYSVSCVARQSCLAVGDSQNSSTGAGSTLGVSAPLVSPGYTTASAGGGVFALGGAPFFGSAGALSLVAPIVGLATTPDGGGYWLVASDGGIFAFGDAGFYGSTGNLALNKPIVGMAATPDGLGYWLVASDGGVFAFGDAGFYGSTGNLTLNKPVVGMAATPSGQGYWLVASDGGVFAIGDAGFFGSAGSLTLAAPIVGMTATPDAGGYWLVGSDGGIFAVGDAAFGGSAAGLSPSSPMVGMAR